MTTMTPSMQLPPGGQQRLAAGSWRVDPAQSHASFAASVVGRPVRGCLPLSGGVLITEPIEDSTALLIARAGAISTGSPVLDRLLAGPGFLDAGGLPGDQLPVRALGLGPGRMAGRGPPAGQEY